MNPPIWGLHLLPFGMTIYGEGASLSQLPAHMRAQAQGLIAAHGLVLFRGFVPFTEEELTTWAATWGEVLQWQYGTMLQLHVVGEPKTFAQACGPVPLHWDGALLDICPSMQILQCVVSAEIGGETFFCHTPTVWGRSRPEQRARWSSIRLEYSVVEEEQTYYTPPSGVACSPLVVPYGDTSVIRFFEPTDDPTSYLQGLRVHGEGMSANEEKKLFTELRHALYHPDVTYTHNWQAGDIVVADNQILLHGRRSFPSDSSRHLRRINIK